MKNNASGLSGIALQAPDRQQVPAHATRPGAGATRSATGLLALGVLAVHIVLLHWVALHLPAQATLAQTAGAPPGRWLLARAIAAPARADAIVSTPPVPPGPERPHADAAMRTPLDKPAAAPRGAEDGDIAAGSSQPAAVATRFYGYDEVETAAEPVSNWGIDSGTLDMLALSRIVVTIWVDERGAVLRCTVDEPQRLTDVERAALAERIANTQLLPARRSGVAVASKRRIELTTNGG